MWSMILLITTSGRSFQVSGHTHEETRPRPLTTDGPVSVTIVECTFCLQNIIKNGFRYYRALESVSILASALSTALTIYPCQIRVHQR